MSSAAARRSIVAFAAFAVPLALGARPAGAQTTTTAPTESTTSTTSTPASTTSTSTTSTTSTTTTTEVTTSTTASPPVSDQGIVVIGANGKTIHAEGAVDAQATGDELAQTGSTTMPVWLTGLTLVISGSLALTFKRRRHLNLYVLESRRRS